MIGFTGLIIAAAFVSWFMLMSGLAMGYYMGKGTFFVRCADDAKSEAMLSICKALGDGQYLEKEIAAFKMDRLTYGG